MRIITEASEEFPAHKPSGQQHVDGFFELYILGNSTTCYVEGDAILFCMSAYHPFWREGPRIEPCLQAVIMKAQHVVASEEYKRGYSRNGWDGWGRNCPPNDGYQYELDYRSNAWKRKIKLTIRLISDTETKDISYIIPYPNCGTVSNFESDILVAQFDLLGIPIENTVRIDHNDRYTCWHYLTYAINQYDFTSRKDALQWLFRRFHDKCFADDKSGISKAEKKFSTALQQLKEKDPFLFSVFEFCQDSTMREKASNNQILSNWLEKCNGDVEKIASDLQNAIDTFGVEQTPDVYGRSIVLMLDGAQDKINERKEKEEWYLRKTLGGQAEGLGCSPALYPLSHKAVSDGSLPINLFHNPSDKLAQVNTEWPVWENALEKGFGECLFSIAKDASRRSTYRKDITPFITFHAKLERYLERHTGYKWTVTPRYVESQWALEMDDADENGTVKKRSAMTPIVDNEKHTVELPYVAVAISGRQVSYCYSEFYYLFEDGFIDPETKSPVFRDLEEKLNGRDDYGLMYYTLTGSPSSRGYPTFLIIFERLSEKTRVHFHRVHPHKFKNGRFVPAFKQIEGCYQYMAGNIPASNIYAQQGDLIFISSAVQDGVAEEVSDFESHRFTSKTMLVPNSTKIKNRLGHVFVEEDCVIKHPEHESVLLKAGWYEVRRCKSWEANPKAVWSRTID